MSNLTHAHSDQLDTDMAKEEGSPLAPRQRLRPPPLSHRRSESTTSQSRQVNHGPTSSILAGHGRSGSITSQIPHPTFPSFAGHGRSESTTSQTRQGNHGLTSFASANHGRSESTTSHIRLGNSLTSFAFASHGRSESTTSHTRQGNNLPHDYGDLFNRDMVDEEATPLAPRERHRPPPLSHGRSESTTSQSRMGNHSLTPSVYAVEPALMPAEGEEGVTRENTLEFDNPWERESDAEEGDDVVAGTGGPGGAYSDDPTRITGGVLLISPKKKKSRAIFVDWARSIAVFVVVAVHITISAGRVTTVQPAMAQKIDGTFRLVLQFGMPMFFYFSGRSAAFTKVGFGVFLRGKILRLVVPLLVGMCVVVIPTNYVGRSFRHCSPPGEDNFFVFWIEYWKNFGCNGFDWYWFLAVLFALSVVNQPFLFWLKNRYKGIHAAHKRKKAENDAIGRAMLCGLFSFSPKTDYPAVLTCIFMFGVSAVAAHALNAPYTVFAVALLPYALLTIVTLGGKLIQRFNLLYILYLPCPVTSLLLAAIVLDPYPDPDAFMGQSGVILMCLFYNFYYIQGYIDTVYDGEWREWRDAASVHATLKPIALLCLIILIALCSPTTSEYGGYLFYFPSYKANNHLCVLYVLGSWVWLMLWIRYSQTFYNEVLNKFEYTHVTNSSMLVYLVHWFFIDLISVSVVKPLGMTTVPAIIVLAVGTCVCCALLYVFLVYLASELQSKKKVRRATTTPALEEVTMDQQQQQQQQQQQRSHDDHIVGGNSSMVQIGSTKMPRRDFNASSLTPVFHPQSGEGVTPIAKLD